VATAEHIKFAGKISQLIEHAAIARGTGIAKRSPEYITEKITQGKAIIAFAADILAGFCYIETWAMANMWLFRSDRG